MGIKKLAQTIGAVVAVGALTLLIAVLFFGGLCIVCGYLQHPPNDTAKAPDHFYSYNLSKNGTVKNVIINAGYSFYLRNDVRYLETEGSNLEVRLWGKSIMPSVVFHQADDTLRVDISAQSYVDNYLGSPRATEYVYLPKNWTYQIISRNEQGDTYVENQSWDYEAHDGIPRNN